VDGRRDGAPHVRARVQFEHAGESATPPPLAEAASRRETTAACRSPLRRGTSTSVPEANPTNAAHSPPFGVVGANGPCVRRHRSKLQTKLADVDGWAIAVNAPRRRGGARGRPRRYGTASPSLYLRYRGAQTTAQGLARPVVRPSPWCYPRGCAGDHATFRVGSARNVASQWCPPCRAAGRAHGVGCTGSGTPSGGGSTLRLGTRRWRGNLPIDTDIGREVDRLASETMRRVRANVEVLVEGGLPGDRFHPIPRTGGT
jgi:hypothetical protein